MYINKLTSVLLILSIKLVTIKADIEDYQNAGLRTVIRIYDECSKLDGGLVPCLKKKAISFIDRLEQIDAIQISDDLKLIRLVEAGSVPINVMTENEIELQLPRAYEDRDTQLTKMLIDRISRFFSGHTLQINFPKVSSDELGRTFNEGRGKMKKMMGMMMMGMAMKMMGMIPVAMAGLYMMAGKALIVSKIALLLAGIMGLKKLMSGRGGNGGGGGGWSSGGGSNGGGGGWQSSGGGSGGWDRRSIDEAQNLAYRGYSSKLLDNENGLLTKHQPNE